MRWNMRWRNAGSQASLWEEVVSRRPPLSVSRMRWKRRASGLMRTRCHGNLLPSMTADVRTGDPMAWVEAGCRQRCWGAGCRGLPGQQRARRGTGTLWWWRWRGWWWHLWPPRPCSSGPFQGASWGPPQPGPFWARLGGSSAPRGYLLAAAWLWTDEKSSCIPAGKRESPGHAPPFLHLRRRTVTRGGRPGLGLQAGQERVPPRPGSSGAPREAYWIWDTRSTETDPLKHRWEIYPQSCWNWKEMEGSGTGWKWNGCLWWLWWNTWLGRSERTKDLHTGAQRASHTLESPASLGEAGKVYKVPLPSFQWCDYGMGCSDALLLRSCCRHPNRLGLAYRWPSGWG